MNSLFAKCALTTLMFLQALVITAQSMYLFVGTYTDQGSKGIYVYQFNTNNGKAKWISNTDSVVNPSYLVIAPDEKHIYAVTETATNNTGSVSAFSFDKSNGKLSFINKQPSGGANPCYISVDATNKWAFVANYTGGSVSAFSINNDGSIAPYSQLFQHEGKSINKQRQEKPHVHAAVLSPDQKYLFTPDLGTDKLNIYKVDVSLTKPLMPAQPAFIKSDSGNGPRHFTFHPNKKFAYLIEEMSGTVATYNWNKSKLKFVQRIKTHKEDYMGMPGSADIHVSPDGKFLYASNRGEENNITIFKINQKDGKLTTIGYEPTGGKTPRNFTIDPTGKYLLVANQTTNNIVVFSRNAVTGLLEKTGEEIKVSKPVCLQMMQY